MKEIKVFIDMMGDCWIIPKDKAVEIAALLRRLDCLELAFEAAPSGDDRPAVQLAYYLECLSHYAKYPIEYQALKALVDRPVSKMEITDELLELVYNEANDARLDEYEEYCTKRMLKVALEAFCSFNRLS